MGECAKRLSAVEAVRVNKNDGTEQNNKEIRKRT